MSRSLLSPPPLPSVFKPATTPVSVRSLSAGPAWISEDAPYGRLVANVFLHPIKTLDVIPGHLANLRRFGIAAGIFVLSTLLLGVAFSTVHDQDVRQFISNWANVPQGPLLGHILTTSLALVLMSAVTSFVGRLLSRGGSFFGTLSVFMWIGGLTNVLFSIAAFAPAPIALALVAIVGIYEIVFAYAALMSLYDLSLIEAIFAAIIVHALAMVIGFAVIAGLAEFGMAGIH